MNFAVRLSKYHLLKKYRLHECFRYVAKTSKYISHMKFSHQNFSGEKLNWQYFLIKGYVIAKLWWISQNFLTTKVTLRYFWSHVIIEEEKKHIAPIYAKNTQRGCETLVKGWYLLSIHFAVLSHFVVIVTSLWMY